MNGGQVKIVAASIFGTKVAVVFNNAIKLVTYISFLN